jgi:hypothetical protein
VAQQAASGGTGRGALPIGDSRKDRLGLRRLLGQQRVTSEERTGGKSFLVRRLNVNKLSLTPIPPPMLAAVNVESVGWEKLFSVGDPVRELSGEWRRSTC